MPTSTSSVPRFVGVFLLALPLSGCATTGVAAHREVVPVYQEGKDRAETVTLPTQVLVFQDQPTAPLGVELDAGRVERTTSYQQFQDETWMRHPWRWKATPKNHLEIAGGMLLGGAVLATAGLIGEGDAKSKGTALGLGVVAIVGSPIPLVVLGVRKLQSKDKLEGVATREAAVGFQDRFVADQPYTGTLQVAASSSVERDLTGTFPVRDGKFLLGAEKLSYVEPVWSVQMTADDRAEIRWDLGAVPPDALYLTHRDYLRANPKVNAAFTSSFKAWKAEEDARVKREYQERLIKAIQTCGEHLLAAETCGAAVDYLFAPSSTFGRGVRDLGCDWAAAKVTGGSYTAGDALETSISSIVRTKYPQYEDLVTTGELGLCVHNEF